MNIDGFIPVHKPVGLTSQQTVSKVKKITGSRKAGHTGTLDPGAEGLLLVALGRATRLTEYFLEGEKGYRASIFFGIATDTGDREGATIAALDSFAISPSSVLAVLADFHGKITQIPPAASAIKIEGQRAYKLFRQGLKPDMPARQVEITSIRPLGLEDSLTPANPVLVVDVLCSKGTYIRSLARDIGSALGCPAYLSGLVRTSMSWLTLDQAASLADLEKGYKNWLLDMSAAVHKLPKIYLDSIEAESFFHGRSITCSDFHGEAAVFSGQRLLGIALVVDGILKPVKVLIQEL